MRCLIVGGTGFLGGALTEAVAAAGHATTVLSRGETTRPLPRGVSVVHADRYGDLSAIEGGEYDWVFDTCAYSPDAVHALLDALGDGVGRYVLVSSISAYGTFAEPGLTETTPVPDPTADDLAVAAAVPASDRASANAYGASYGPLKRDCEIAAAARLGDRATVLRVGLLVGAGDYTDRLTWWVRRIDTARGARRRVPAPGPPERSVQVIDVHDVAQFALLCAEKQMPGIWNVTGSPMRLSGLLDEVIRSADAPAKIVWISERKVVDAGVTPWTDFPLMKPVGPDFRHFLEVGTGRAVAAGLIFTPLSETLAALLAWDRGRRDRPLTCGLSPEQEAVLLEQAN